MKLIHNKIFFCVRVGFCFSLLFFAFSVKAEVITEENILQMINFQREGHELQPLIKNDALSDIARLRAEDMVVNNYFSHQSPSGLMPWDLALQKNYDYNILGENLALNYYDTEKVQNDWMNSTDHRNNILNPQYSETGINIAVKNNHLLIVQIFASPRLPNNHISTTNDINDQSMTSIIPNNSDAEKFVVLGIYNVSHPENYQNDYLSRTSTYNLWIFLLTLAFFPISMFLLLIPDKTSINHSS